MVLERAKVKVRVRVLAGRNNRSLNFSKDVKGGRVSPLPRSPAQGKLMTEAEQAKELAKKFYETRRSICEIAKVVKAVSWEELSESHKELLVDTFTKLISQGVIKYTERSLI